MSSETSQDGFRIERHGEVIVLVVSSEVETLSWDLVAQAAQIILVPIRQEQCPLLLIDLSNVNFFGSVFLSLLLLCWKQVASTGGMMVVCGASSQARELLRITALDSLWAIYDSRAEAIEVLESN